MIKTAIIGAGGIAEKHAQAVNRLPDIKVISVLDINLNNAYKIAGLCNARVIDRIEDVLDEVDMIHLLTPPSRRLEYAETAMNAGKHILCEKPIAVSLEDAQKLTELSHKNNILFMTAFNMRFRKGYLKLQEDVLSGRLGEIVSIWIQRTGPGSGFRTPLRDSWRTDPELACGMSVESLSHDIDMIRGLGLEITSVFSWVKGTRADLPSFDNNAHVIMGLNNGGSAVVNASWDSHLPMSSRGVIGTKGTAVLSGRGFFDFMEYRIFTDGMEQEDVININDPFDAESYYEENKYFLECIQKNKKPCITAENGLEALKVSLAILESNKKRLPVEI
jgi:myo-inositol 2-dehydrogenase/D-chiro-inositol 1-dehydrogenase